MRNTAYVQGLFDGEPGRNYVFQAVASCPQDAASAELIRASASADRFIVVETESVTALSARHGRSHTTWYGEVARTGVQNVVDYMDRRRMDGLEPQTASEAPLRVPSFMPTTARYMQEQVMGLATPPKLRYLVYVVLEEETTFLEQLWLVRPNWRVQIGVVFVDHLPVQDCVCVDNNEAAPLPNFTKMQLLDLLLWSC
jgi:hypothetical protein